jgi:hypothetical protein
MSDRYYIRIIINRIEKKLRWGKVSQWTDHEYKRLSTLIYDDTSISISAQTLKRLFGKIKYKDDYKAQPATKDALARFLGYTDWEKFVKDSRYVLLRLLPPPLTTNFRAMRPAIRLLVPSGIILLLLLAWIMTGARKNTLSIYAENVTGTVPHTISIHYDISGRKNNVYIDFDQDEAELNNTGELLNKNLKLINHCFESPGFYNVRFKSRGKVIDSVKVLVKSDGWGTYYFNDDNFILRKFIFGLEHKVQAPENNGILYFSRADLNSRGFNGNTVYYLEHMLYSDFPVSADSSMLEVKYKNSSEIGGISCYDVEFRIIAENGIVSVILVQKGCYRWSEITVGKKHLNGKYDDLSFLSADLSFWNTMKIDLSGNKAFFINNNDTLFSTGYDKPLGQIKGIRFLTKGSGAFDYVKLTDNQNKLIFEDNFGD